MWDRVFAAHSRLFGMYGTMIQTANASMTAAMENTARLQCQQLDLMREAIDRYGSFANRAWDQPMVDFLEQQSRVAAEQSSRGLDLWREFLGAAAEAEDATLSATQGEVQRAIEATKKAGDEATRTAKQAGDEATRTAKQATDSTREAGRSAMAAAQKAWSGPERRKKIMTPYSGLERRKAA